mmetsp:Transcript_80672/g.184870  ORF Transcript_80672/g.184870 Transcript_80672/m.184870 type:complete len:341 (-) Transcript_80672:106-1128(-)
MVAIGTSLREALTHPGLTGLDFLVCAQPMPLCSVLRTVTELPLLLYIAFPLIGATPKLLQPFLMAHFSEMARQPGRTAFIPYSKFLQRQLVAQTGVEFPLARPHSLYAFYSGPASYNPDRGEPRVLVSRMAGWARESGRAFALLCGDLVEQAPKGTPRFVFLGATGLQDRTNNRLGEWTNPFSYRDLSRFTAAVQFPWDMGMLMFNEFYSINLPTFLPSKRWLVLTMQRLAQTTDFGWWQVRRDHGLSAPTEVAEAEGDLWMDENSTASHVAGLYDLTDFALWPHILYFDSLPDLIHQSGTTDYDAVSAGMAAWNQGWFPASLQVFVESINLLLPGRGTT